MYKKIVVLDTNVLLSRPESIQDFPEFEVVVIPMRVLEELDTKKVGHTELARNARHVARTLEAIRCNTNLQEGVILTSGSLLRVLPDSPHMWRGLAQSSDNIILTTAMRLKDDGHDVTMVSNDINVRLKASGLQLPTMGHKTITKAVNDTYTGHSEIEVEASLIEEFRNTGKCPIEGEFNANEFITITDAEDVNNFAHGRYDVVTGSIAAIDLAKQRSVWGLTPKNIEQQFAMDLLLNDNIKLVTICGKAGSGKSILSLAAGLQKVEETKYTKMLLIKNPISVGEEIGYLPGNIEEKMSPWMVSVKDSLEVLMEGGSNKGGKRKKTNTDALFEQGLLQVEPLSFIRGRSVTNSILLIEEGQNVDYLTMKTIITRAGENTKVVLIGDPSQIDAKGLDSENNGLSHVMRLFKNNEIYGHITLQECERSDLAALATEVMK